MGERHAAASGVYGGDRRLAVGVDAARSRTVSMDERTVSVGESHAAASGVYGGDRRLAVGVGAARSRTVSWTNGRYRWASLQWATPLRAASTATAGIGGCRLA
ncbi:MAG: hypothetical protein IPM07_23750 [Anaerolineales bacterium]|nr:hypothetical protein [Anaerolineales bacterium]